MKPRSSVAFSLHSKMNFKIIVVGEKGVGKTSLVVRYVKDIFNKNYAVTVGVEFYSKTLTIYDE
jgi:GTPase SAR1 family protein